MRIGQSPAEDSVGSLCGHTNAQRKRLSACPPRCSALEREHVNKDYAGIIPILQKGNSGSKNLLGWKETGPEFTIHTLTAGPDDLHATDFTPVPRGLSPLRTH